MPRSTQQIIEQAEELAQKFEAYESGPEDEVYPGEALVVIHHAVRERAEAERHVYEAVRYARKDGLPWAAIGAALGTTGEAARQRYAESCAV